jgi:hypothetical protein
LFVLDAHTWLIDSKQSACGVCHGSTDFSLQTCKHLGVMTPMYVPVVQGMASRGAVRETDKLDDYQEATSACGTGVSGESSHRRQTAKGQQRRPDQLAGGAALRAGGYAATAVN